MHCNRTATNPSWAWKVRVARNTHAAPYGPALAGLVLSADGCGGRGRGIRGRFFRAELEPLGIVLEM